MCGFTVVFHCNTYPTMRNFEANNVDFIFGTVFNIAFVASMQQSNLESRNFKLVERSVSDAETTTNGISFMI